MSDSTEKTFKNTFSYKLIYIFAIPDDAHAGSVKVGDTKLDTDLTQDRLQPNCKELNQAALERIKTYTKTASVKVNLLHTELAIRTTQKKDGSWNTESFRDYDVHRVLLKSGIKKKNFGDEKLGNEWFSCDDVTAIKAITAVKHGDTSIDTLIPMEKFIPINFRPEQKEAIEKTVKRFKKSSRMLWNAKMRFGKTLSALEVVRRMDFERTVLITHRPVVDDGWHEDFKKIFTKEDKYRYGSKKSGIEISELEKTFKKDKKHYIYFASIQDLRGSKIVGGKFDKNDDVFNIDWDCVIIDEAHEGTTTKLGDEVKSLLFKEKEGTKLLELSGTPFNILENYDDESSVYTWDYVMEQKAKREWEENHFGDSNPYSDLPEMNMLTYNLGKALKSDGGKDKAFNFSEFFRTNENGNFEHESDVFSFLNLLTKKSDESFYPFSSDEYRNLFHHTLWMVPGVKEALALQHLMQKHPVFQTFEIVNVAGDGDPEDPTGEALAAVKTAIENAGEDGYTITLSCGKLTTGVSVPEWTAVFMLSGSYTTKASGYLQTIFRVQTPCNKYGKTKTQTYVFDFAPDRTLKMVADSVALSAKAGKTKIDDKIRLGEFLNFCPVIGIEGSTMKPYQVGGLLQELKSSYAERAVTKGFDDASIYNDELLKLSSVELQKFKDLQAIIGETKANNSGGKIDVNVQGLTEEEYENLEKQKPQKEKRELSFEEQEAKKKIQEAKKIRLTAISVLRGISIRMPLLIYGARGKNGDEIPVDEDITLKKFVELVDETSWEEFMPRGVTKENFADFEKYYDEDVFIAAGRRIRNLVVEADKLSITERVRKIAEIFSYFRNPDKEIVLTPWRVVNMHLGDCLGGYSFFDADYEKPLVENEEPHFIQIDGVTEKTLSNTDAKILEINSKTGLYPLYCAYSIFRAKKEFHSERSEKSLWNETIEENIFVICKTPMAKAITQRTLSGYGNIKINAHYFEDLVNQLKNKSDSFISKVTSKNYWGKGDGGMEFDAIVGNPPYQEMDKGKETSTGSSMPVYNFFVENSIKLNPFAVSLIMPSRWMTGGRGLDSFREKMLKNHSIYAIHDYLESHDVFPSVAIEGGVCYFLWLKNYNGKCKFFSHQKNNQVNLSERFLDENNSDVVIRDAEMLNILKKVKIENFKPFSDLILPRNPFGIRQEAVFSDSEAIYKILGRFNSKRGLKFFDDKSIISKNIEYLKSWKVFMSKADGAAGQIGNPIPAKILGNPEIGEPNTICTETFLCITPFETKNEVLNCIKYIKTKFFRFMVGIRKNKNMTRDTYTFVPLQDFTSTSDIDWSKPVPEIDAQLYQKYNLSDDEIAFIEKMIRPME